VHDKSSLLAAMFRRLQRYSKAAGDTSPISSNPWHYLDRRVPPGTIILLTQRRDRGDAAASAE